MKITKTKLRQIIKEEVQRMEESIPGMFKFADPSAPALSSRDLEPTPRSALQVHLARAERDLEDVKAALASGRDVDGVIDGLEILIDELRAQIERASS